MNLLVYKEVTPKPFDKQRWIVNSRNGRNILLNQKSFDLLDILKQSTDESEAHKKFQEHFKLVVSKQDFQNLVSKTFDQIIGDPPETVRANRKKFLTLKIPLLKAQYAGLLASPFTNLFAQRIFWPVFVSTLVLNIFFLVFSVFNVGLSPNDVLSVSILIGISMPIHEFGHIAACKKFGIKHGEIGFGFYLIFPIVYADITQIWNAPRAKRIIANLGGIYLELIYTLALFTSHSISGTNIFLWSAVGVFVKLISELNPFIRYDGYWLLSEITNTPNLILKSKQSARNVLSNLVKHGPTNHPTTSRNRWLALYALFNGLVIAAYFAYVIVVYHIEILNFPIAVYSILTQIHQFNFSSINFPEGFFWILGLYIICLKIIFSLALRIPKCTSLFSKKQNQSAVRGF